MSSCLREKLTGFSANWMILWANSLLNGTSFDRNSAGFCSHYSSFLTAQRIRSVLSSLAALVLLPVVLSSLHPPVTIAIFTFPVLSSHRFSSLCSFYFFLYIFIVYFFTSTLLVKWFILVVVGLLFILAS